MQQFNQNNPEYEFSRQELMKRRRFEQGQGWVLALIGGIGTLLTALLMVVSFKQLLLLNAVVVIVFIAFLVGFMMTFAVGITSLRHALKLPTEQQIAAVRRFQRSRLMQQAQGKLPWSYRCSGQMILTGIGLILVAMAVFILFTFGLPSWDAWLEGVFGLALILYALIVVPGERQRLPRESAELLAQALIAGEVTEGSPVEPEEQ